MTVLITVWGASPGVVKSTLCAGPSQWLADTELRVDHFREEEILTRPQFAAVAEEFKATGSVEPGTLIAATARFVDAVVGSGDDVVIADALMPFVPTLPAMGHGEETIDAFIAVVLNVGQAHLGEFGSRAAIATAKGELVQGLAPGVTAVLNIDDPRVVAMRSLTDRPVRTFGRVEHADVRALGLALDRLGRPSFTLRTADASAPVALPHVGAHQALNASAAVAAGLVAGVPLDMAAPKLATASLSRWRMELRDLAGGATLLNDSYNANPDSTRAALDALAAVEGGRRLAVLGEMLELGDESEAEHRAVGEYATARADVVVAVGKAALPIAEGAGDRAVALTDNGAAIRWLRNHLAAEDVVLVKASRGARLDEVAAALT
ncbi:glutamate ligase domain-containing protein [Streptomyces canus]|uniref:UDP-N-acetylmuramoyl-tripeptide--D-alanyl-D- alanine ligase n=1 Tax=Streptomyces canus TaxID=58343 RepID=UPI0036E727B3